MRRTLFPASAPFDQGHEQIGRAEHDGDRTHDREESRLGSADRRVGGREHPTEDKQKGHDEDLHEVPPSWQKELELLLNPTHGSRLCAAWAAAS